MQRAFFALDIGGGHERPAVERLAEYYDPASEYAGATFAGIEPNDEMYIGAADLWAVGTLSMQRFMTPLLGRRLLTPGVTRTNVTRQLRRLPSTLPNTEISDEILLTMEELQNTLRTFMSEDANRWVFASKMCARKRPMHFPVRDELVCTYLADDRGLGRGEGKLGRFRRDIQVFAYLMSSQAIKQRLSELYRELQSRTSGSVDIQDLRVLDAALWTAAKFDDSQPEPPEAPDAT